MADLDQTQCIRLEPYVVELFLFWADLINFKGNVALKGLGEILCDVFRVP
jgi:hypothetical protein